MTISAAYRAPEPDLLPPLMRAAGVDPATRQRIVARAGTLVAAMQKAATSAGGLAQFLHEYRISTTEGVVLLCLAEAFLRIPDEETADHLIRDKLGPPDWQAQLGQSRSEAHTSELQSQKRTSYAVICLKQNNNKLT